MNNNSKAITVYLDDVDKMEQELTWLYKTWILFSLEKEYDLVVYYHPDAKERIKNFPNIIAIEMPYVKMAKDYKFLNSHYFCLDEYNEPLLKYDFLFKTDCDVFFTKNMKNFKPSKFLIGQGGYYDQKDDNKINFIKKVSQELGLGYNNMTNIGASFFAKTHEVLAVVKMQAQITEYVLQKYFKTDRIEKESQFRVGISSMIAGEVAINHMFNSQHINLYSLDSKCWKTSVIGSDTLHIHAWHTDIPWSKHRYFEGKYANWEVPFKEAFENGANYCHWIATTSIEDIKAYREILNG